MKRFLTVTLLVFGLSVLLYVGVDTYYEVRFSSSCEKLTWGDSYATFNCYY